MVRERGDTIVWGEVEGLGGLGPHGEGERGHNSLGGGGGTRGGWVPMVRERGDTIVWEEVEGLGGLGPHGEGERGTQ